MKRDGFIGVRRRRRHGEDEWITACFPSRNDHNERSVFMLFRLLPALYRDNPELFAATQGKADLNGTQFDDIDDVQSLDEQLQRYGKGTVPEAYRVPLSPMPQPKLNKAKKPPVATPDEDDSRFRFHTRGGDSLIVPESADIHLPLLNTTDPTHTTIGAENTSTF